MVSSSHVPASVARQKIRIWAEAIGLDSTSIKIRSDGIGARKNSIQCIFLDLPLKKSRQLAQNQEMNPEITTEWLPAWPLIAESDLAKVLKLYHGEGIRNQVFATASCLVNDPGPTDKQLAFRRELQCLQPGLLQFSLLKSPDMLLMQ